MLVFPCVVCMCTHTNKVFNICILAVVVFWACAVYVIKDGVKIYQIFFLFRLGGEKYYV